MSASAPQQGPSPQRVAELLSKPTMRVEETAEVLGISRGAAYRAVKAGQLPSFEIGRRLLVPTAPVRRMLEGPTRPQDI